MTAAAARAGWGAQTFGVGSIASDASRLTAANSEMRGFYSGLLQRVGCLNRLHPTTIGACCFNNTLQLEIAVAIIHYNRSLLFQ